jgi:hypothetical protein
LIIHHGQLVVSGPVAELRRGDRPRLAVRVTGDGDASWAAGLGPATGTVDAVRADGTAEISITSAADSHPLHPGDAGQQAGRRGQAWLQRVRETAVRPVRPVSQNVAALAAQGSKWPHSTRSVVKSEDREGRSAAHFLDAARWLLLPRNAGSYSRIYSYMTCGTDTAANKQRSVVQAREDF